ncbi:MAG: translocation/assembly module TamB [Verrucomicrobia bacterium]|nr:translocation/assembly module TamB [Verrucomicrobiota bacterium]
MKWIKWILTSAFILLALAVGLFLLAQSPWGKDKIGMILEEIALQQGFKLKIEKIEGDLPLKWTLSQVHLELNQTDSIDIDRLRIRLSILPLLRKKIGIRYLSADKTIYRFKPAEKSASSSLPPLPPYLAIHMMKINHLEAVNLSTGNQAFYSLSGNCNIKRRGAVFNLHAKVRSSDLDLTLFIQGNKKLDSIIADLNVSVESQKAFAPFVSLPFDIAFHLETSCAGPWKTWKTFLASPQNPLLPHPIQGNLKLDVKQLTLPALQGLDENLSATTAYSLLSDRSIKLSALNLKSDLLCIKGDAELDRYFSPRGLEGSFLLPHLSRLSPELKGIAKGDILYKGDHCKISLKSDQLDMREAAFTDAKLYLEARQMSGSWNGTWGLSALHPDLRFQASGSLKLQSERLNIEGLSLQAPETTLAGDFSLDLPQMKNLSGGLSFQIGDLKPYSQLLPIALAGQLAGQVNFQGENTRCHAIAKALKIGKFLSDQIDIDLNATDIFHGLKGKFDIESQKGYLADIYFTSASYTMAWDNDLWSYALKMDGEWKNPFNIRSEGHFSFSPENFELNCHILEGALLQKNLHLEQPFTAIIQPKAVSLTDFKLKIENGFIHSSFQLSPESSRMTVQAEHFPLDFLTLLSHRFSLQGLSSIDLALSGSNRDLTGHCNLLLEHADIFPAGGTTPIKTKASLQANLNHDTAQVHTHIVASGEQFVDLSATLPVSYQLYPFNITVDRQKPLAGQCTIEGHIEQLFDFINIGTQRFGGLLSTRLVGSGSLEKLAFFGPLTIQNGFYQNYFIGIGFQNAAIEAVANGSTLDIHHIDVQDESSGTATATAVFHLEPNLPFSVEGEISHFRVIRFDWLAASCSGPFTITGNLESALAEGSLTVDEAEIQIPDQLPTTLVSLPVTFINQPKTYTPPVSNPYPFHYDLRVQGEENIHLTGRGLDAQLAGNLHIAGQNLDVVPSGALKTQKGKFSFSGKDFKITEGEVSFTEAGSFVNITGNLDLTDLKVLVTFRGSLKSPQLLFQSNPPLPTSSILARILFNKDVSELNASQAGQLAYTIISLSGGSGPSILETIHKNLGIDRLGISSNEQTGKISVQIGKYLTEGVMITLSQSTEQSHVIVEVELKGGFVLQAETHLNDQGKLIFKWNKNY